MKKTTGKTAKAEKNLPVARKSRTAKSAAMKASAKGRALQVAEKNLPVADSADVSTAQWLFNECNRLAIEACGQPFQVDACAAEWNTKVPTYWDAKKDALKQDWTEHKSVYCNPPWEKSLLPKLVEKAIEAAQHGTTTVMVVPFWNQSWLRRCEKNGRVHRVAGPVAFHRQDGTRWTMNNNKNTSNLLVVVFGPGVKPGNGDTILRRLSEAEQARLKELEARVSQWYEATVTAAEALCAIQDEGLYEADYETFEAYVEANWGRSRQWAYDMMAWHRVNSIAGILDKPLAVSAARLLKQHLRNPELLCKIIAEAQAKSGVDRPTAEHIAEARTKLVPKVAARQVRQSGRGKRQFRVSLGGTDLGKVQSLSRIPGVMEVTSDEDGLDLIVTNLDALFAKLAKLVAKHGGLRVSLGITEEEKEESEKQDEKKEVDQAK